MSFRMRVRVGKGEGGFRVVGIRVDGLSMAVGGKFKAAS